MDKHTRLLEVMIILILYLLSGCAAIHPVERGSFDHQYSAAEISEINIDLHAGQIYLVGGGSTELTVSASLVHLDTVIEKQQDSILNLSYPDSETGDEIIIQITPGIVVNVNTFSGDVTFTDVIGQIEVSSVAGDIFLDAFSGEALLWAGRGDVEVINGTGGIVVIGEHGTLSVSRFDGDVSMTTIMGTLKYLGAKSINNSARLESDHGPVEVLLPKGSNLNIQVNTTSGLVTCLGPDLSQTITGCEGVLGEGAGSLNIRTVSGRVDLKVIPNE